MKGNEGIPICSKKTDSLFLLLVVINIVSMAVGMLLYGEPFNFWQDAISYLGATKTVNGYPNYRSFFIFSLGMSLSCFIMMKIAFIFHCNDKINYHRLKRNLALFAGTGFFVIIFPCNINNSIHSAGGALLFGDLWGLTLLFLIEAGKLPGASYITLYHFILHSTVLAYAFNFVIQSGILQITQKFAVFSLIVILKLTTSLYRLIPQYEDETNTAGQLQNQCNP